MQAQQKWTTHFAYNNVTQIAVSPDKAFAISDGSLYSVDKQSEQIKVYNNQSGLHGTGISCIHYDATGEQLIICYGTGKIDLLSSHGVRYIGTLYDKDMTQQKTIYNVTLSGRTAYLATAYGVQTMDMRERKLVDSYWLRPGGQETEVKDVLLAHDSIYAFTDDSLFCAAMSDNLVDYTVWHREKSGRVSPDSEKGIHYQDATSHWYAGHAEGIVRFTATERLTYKPQGPLTNKPYYVSAAGNQVFMLSGGRWTAQDNTPGHVMRYTDNTWHNIPADSIKAASGAETVLDFMNVAVDPNDPNHYFVTSYGTGLYEFQGDRCISHTYANGVIQSAISNNPTRYTRLTGAHFDEQGRLWFLDAGAVNYPVIIQEGDTYTGLPLVADGESQEIHIPCDIVMDRRNSRLKWIGCAYKSPGILLLDDQGTPLDASDDRVCLRREWVNQHGQAFKPENIFAMMQDSQGRLWLATEQGAAYIDAETDFFTSDAIIQPQVTDNNGENPITTLRIKALCQATNGEIWIGSESLGVYVLNETATDIVTHYTSDNSAMSANGILSLATDINGHIWIGSAEGLVEYNPDGHNEGLKSWEDDSEELDEGSMMQWRLHFSYSNPEQVAATPQAVFAAANGSLFSVDRADNQIVYWNKATGLKGTSVARIAYDGSSEQLIIAYENGQIDLLDAQGDVTQMPDISMKAGSIDVTIKNICIGSRFTYLAMPFGIIAIQPRKAEVTDTYYIGSDAAAVEVQHIAESGDTLYAFSYDRMYKGALGDNLVDYSFWHSEDLPFEQAQQVITHNEHLYALAHDSLYRREGATWHLVFTTPLNWIHVNDNRLLAYAPSAGLIQITDDHQPLGLSNNYEATDAVYTNGEYWLAEEGKGLVRLGTEGDEAFRPEGPMSNFGYHLDIAHDRLYVSPGGRWADSFARRAGMSIYDGQQWIGIPWQNTWYYTGHDIRDVVGYAVDKNDPGHFFVATYGTGVFEFKDYNGYRHYDRSNSSLEPTETGGDDYYYTRTDGAMMDEDGNLWVLNSTTSGKPLHVRTPEGIWYGMNLRANGTNLSLTTPGKIWVDKRNSQRKWMMDQRITPSLILLDDGGTPVYNGDDRCIARSTFVDQNNNTISPTTIRCLAQDQKNRIWIGTQTGILILSEKTDFFTSNACQRIIIPRNDGTGLGDYLLGNEQINCLAVDGGNRMWIGTANSGLYLIEDDTITVAHFTENNSLLPSDNIQSIAIMPKTGEVFVGTDKGIASYRSDASEAAQRFKDAYAFPNPVRPDYGGMISICGLKENTVVNIVDAGGNLVCKTRSNGGTAVWDGKLPDGRRATPGVYTALCNAKHGHTAVKILFIR